MKGNVVLYRLFWRTQATLKIYMDNLGGMIIQQTIYEFEKKFN